MNISYHVGTAKHPANVREKLKNIEQQFVKKGYPMEIDEENLGNYHFLKIKLEGPTSDKPQNSGAFFNQLNHNLAEALGEFILEKFEQQLLDKIVRSNYYYLDQSERREVLVRALAALAGGQADLDRRGRQVISQIRDYLSQHHDIIMEGFINFRLKEYRKTLTEVVDNAVDDFLMEKEYDEFIQLLQYFVDIQDPRVEAVHVVFKQDGVFELYDGSRRPIDNDYLEGFILDLADNEINYEDLLISALITIAPRDVTIHAPDKRQFRDTVKTIRNVFGSRASDCPGCELCLNQGQRKK